MLVFDDQHMAKIKSQNDMSCCFLQFDQTNKVDGAMKNALKLKDARKVWFKQKWNWTRRRRRGSVLDAVRWNLASPNLSKLLTRVANFSHQQHWWWAEVFAQTSQDEASAFCKLFLANNQNSTGVQVRESPWNVTLWGLTNYTNNRGDCSVAFCKLLLGNNQNCTGVPQSEPGVTYDLTDESTVV